VSRLESAAGGRVDLVLLDEAGPGLVYRAFATAASSSRETGAHSSAKGRAILEYLDFRPIEETFTRAVLGASNRD